MAPAPMLFLLTKVGHFSLINPQLTSLYLISLIASKIALQNIFVTQKVGAILDISPSLLKVGAQPLPQILSCSAAPVHVP